MVTGGGAAEGGVFVDTLASILVILLDKALFCGTVVVAGLLALALFSGIATLHKSRPGGKKSVTLL